MAGVGSYICLISCYQVVASWRKLFFLAYGIYSLITPGQACLKPVSIGKSTGSKVSFPEEDYWDIPSASASAGVGEFPKEESRTNRLSGGWSSNQPCKPRSTLTGIKLDRPQSLFYFVPQEKWISPPSSTLTGIKRKLLNNTIVTLLYIFAVWLSLRCRVIMLEQFEAFIYLHRSPNLSGFQSVCRGVNVQMYFVLNRLNLVKGFWVKPELRAVEWSFGLSWERWSGMLPGFHSRCKILLALPPSWHIEMLVMLVMLVTTAFSQRF